MSVDPNNLSGTAKLTFNDDFNSLSLWNGSAGTWSTTFWYQDPNGKGSTITTTQEQEWYINANYGPTSYLKPWNANGGLLTLTAAPASSYTQSLIGPYAYTSGEVNTYHSFAQTYGYFEMRAKLPAGQGFWPAFWLLPADGSWPPELDIMEVLSSNPTTLITTSHSTVSGSLGNNAQVTNTTTGFHTYGVDWEPDFITWYFDGKKVFQIATPSDMNKPMYMVVNLAVGGTFAGNADGVSTAQMDVDYVRAYSAVNAGGSATTSYDAATDTLFTNASYSLPSNIHNLTLTGAGQTVSGNDLDNVITSNNNNNTLNGGAGNDTLIAGRGHDILTGGVGNDTFVYNQFPWDTGLITDFTLGQDRVDVSGMLESVGYTGTDPVGAGYITLKANAAGVTEVWFDPDGKGPGGAYWAFTLAGVQASSLKVQDSFIVAAASTGTGQTGSGSNGGSTGDGGTTPPSSSSVSVSAASYTAPAGVTSITLTGSNQTVQGNNAGDTFYSNNNANKLLGGTGSDTFYLGRGGDSATSNGGTDTFVFKEVPWGAGHIVGFDGQDSLDLQFFQRYGYGGSDPVADGRLKLVADGVGGTQVWAVLDGLSGVTGTWLVTTLDGVSPSNLAWQNGKLVDPPTSGGGSTGTPGQTYTSDNSGDHWTGTAGADVFNLGRGGDVVTGNGGADVFKFAEIPWAGAHITDFGSDDVLDLSGMFARYDYTAPNPIADDRLVLAADGHGGTQVWFAMDGLSGGSGTWLVATLDGVAPSSLGVSGGKLTTGAGGGTAGQTYTSDNAGDHWTGTVGADVFNLGRGGDVVTGNGGNDVFKFAEVPWAGSHVTDFGAGDTLDLSGMFARYGYANANPLGDRLTVTADGHGDAQVWFKMDGLSGGSGTWLLTTLDHVDPASLHVSGAFITG